MSVERRRHVSPFASLLVAGLLVAGPARAQGSIGIASAHQKLSDAEGGFAGGLDDGDELGTSAVSLGDLDGDGVSDLALGAASDDDGGPGRGAVHLVLLDADGTAKAQLKISATAGGFGGLLQDEDGFGSALAALGDLDGDGVGDLAVGAAGDDDGGKDRGAVWVLLLNADGTVKAQQKISATAGGFGGGLDDEDEFGASAAGPGDLDGDGVVDLVVGAPSNAGGGALRGAVWVLFLNADGTVKAQQKISDTAGGFAGELDDGDRFGSSVASLGDFDGDGVVDLAVGAVGDDDGGSSRGAVWLLLLQADGTVQADLKISSTAGGFLGALEDKDRFGSSVAFLGDLDDDGVGELGVGAVFDDDGGTHRGALWLLFLRADGTVRGHQEVNDLEGGFTGDLDDEDRFGAATTFLGDVDGDGVGDLAVGAPRDDDGGADRGAVWILFLTGGEQVIDRGSGKNPLVYLPAADPPAVGHVWRPFIELPSDGDPIFNILAFSSTSSDFLAGPPPPGILGELLIGPVAGFLVGPPGEPFEVPIPVSPRLVGLQLFTQAGLGLSPDLVQLTNGIQIVIGLPPGS